MSCDSSLNYKNKMEANLNELLSLKGNLLDNTDMETVQSFETHLSKTIKVESKFVSKNTEFKIVLDKAPLGNYIDIKVNPTSQGPL